MNDNDPVTGYGCKYPECDGGHATGYCRPDCRPHVPDPCTQEARDQGCICTLSSVNSATIDPPHEVIDRWCPLHGSHEDPDAAYEQARDDAIDFPPRDWGMDDA